MSRWSRALALVAFLGCRVPVDQSVERVLLSPDSIRLQPGDTMQLVAQVIGSDGTVLKKSNIRWSSSDSSIVSVTSRGLISAGRPGVAQVSASVGGRSASVPVTVRFLALHGQRDIAHRGYAVTFPENTVVAVAGAFRLDADGVEVDVRLTYDGFPVVIHDATVDRTTNGTGAVNQLTLAQIRTLDACSWKGPQWGHCEVPLFEEAVAAARGKGLLFVDLKGPWPSADLGRLLATLDAHGMRDSAVLISFSIDELRRVRRVDPRVKIGWLVGKPEDPAPLLELGGGAVLVEQAAIREAGAAMLPYVARVREAGCLVGAWTLRSSLAAATLRDLGVSWFISDVPLDSSSINAAAY